MQFVKSLITLLYVLSIVVSASLDESNVKKGISQKNVEPAKQKMLRSASRKIEEAEEEDVAAEEGEVVVEYYEEEEEVEEEEEEVEEEVQEYYEEQVEEEVVYYAEQAEEPAYQTQQFTNNQEDYPSDSYSYLTGMQLSLFVGVLILSVTALILIMVYKQVSDKQDSDYVRGDLLTNKNDVGVIV